MRFPLQIQNSKNLPFSLVYMYWIFFFSGSSQQILCFFQGNSNAICLLENYCWVPWKTQDMGRKMSRGKPCPNLGQAAKFPREKSCLLNHYLRSVKVSKHYNKFALRSNKAEREADVIRPDRPRFLAGSYSTILDSFRFWILVYNNKMTSPC